MPVQRPHEQLARHCMLGREKNGDLTSFTSHTSYTPNSTLGATGSASAPLPTCRRDISAILNACSAMKPTLHISRHPASAIIRICTGPHCAGYRYSCRLPWGKAVGIVHSESKVLRASTNMQRYTYTQPQAKTHLECITILTRQATMSAKISAVSYDS